MNKYIEKILAQKFSPLISNSGIPRLFQFAYGGVGHILMFHRIIPLQNRQRLHNHLTLEVTPEHLQNIIQYFISKNYDIISLDALPDRLRSKEKKFVVFTLDDGYIDNYTYAYPIFKKNNIPFTIYITTDFPENKCILWWYLLEELILTRNNIAIIDKGNMKSWPCKTHHEKEKAFYRIRDFLISSAEADIINFFKSYEIDVFNSSSNFAMNWKQIIELSKDPLVTIAAHTMTHRALSKLNKNEVMHEIRESGKFIESKINKPVEHFSYPFGSRKESGEREFQITRNLGFITATTTRLANLFPNHINYTYALPRITINSSVNKHVLNLMTSGFLPAIRNNFNRIVYK